MSMLYGEYCWYDCIGIKIFVFLDFVDFELLIKIRDVLVSGLLFCKLVNFLVEFGKVVNLFFFNMLNINVFVKIVCVFDK